jgi:hypothetical protein
VPDGEPHQRRQDDHHPHLGPEKHADGLFAAYAGTAQHYFQLSPRRDRHEAARENPLTDAGDRLGQRFTQRGPVQLYGGGPFLTVDLPDPRAIALAASHVAQQQIGRRRHRHQQQPGQGEPCVARKVFHHRGSISANPSVRIHRGESDREGGVPHHGSTDFMIARIDSIPSPREISAALKNILPVGSVNNIIM